MFSVAVAVFLPLAVNLLVRDYQRDLLARAKATPLVAGAPGSRLDLVLHALYFRGKPAHDLAMSDLDAINSSGLALGMPISTSIRHAVVPIVGTSLEYFVFRGLRVANGEGLTRLGDCVLGAAAAEKLGLHPGDTLMSDPENVLDLAGSYPINMHVTGILAPPARPTTAPFSLTQDRVAHHGHHARPSGRGRGRSQPAAGPRREQRDGQRGPAALPGSDRRERRLFHVHGDPATFPVGAIIVVPHDEKSAAILRGRFQDPKAAVQLSVPQQVVAETLDLVFRVKRFFDAQALLVAWPRCCCWRWSCSCRCGCGGARWRRCSRSAARGGPCSACKPTEIRCGGRRVALAVGLLVAGRPRSSAFRARPAIAAAAASRRPLRRRRPRKRGRRGQLSARILHAAHCRRARRYHLSRAARGGPGLLEA